MAAWQRLVALSATAMLALVALCIDTVLQLRRSIATIADALAHLFFQKAEI